MNVVDSSAWLEFFAGTKRAQNFEQAILDTDHLVVPVICLYEVFKSINRQRSESDALAAVAAMQQGYVANLTVPLSLAAARISAELSLPMADSLILATAREYDATIWTQDADFKDLSDVRYFPKKRR